MSGRVYKGRARAGQKGKSRVYTTRKASAGARMARRMGGTMVNALARVHTFKRMALEMAIVNKIGNVSPDLYNAAGSGAFPYLQIGGYANDYIAGSSHFAGALTFQLAQLASLANPGALTDITNLFDNYRIAKVSLRFDLSYNNAPGGTGVAGYGPVTTVPLIHICPDYDDNSIPASREGVMENAYARSYKLDRSFTMTITPRAQTVVSTGATTTSTGAGGLLPVGTWLDCASPQIPHFGAKFWIEDFPVCPTGSAGPSAQIRITPTYYLECKNVI